MAYVCIQYMSMRMCSLQLRPIVIDYSPSKPESISQSRGLPILSSYPMRVVLCNVQVLEAPFAIQGKRSSVILQVDLFIYGSYKAPLM